MPEAGKGEIIVLSSFSLTFTLSTLSSAGNMSELQDSVEAYEKWPLKIVF